ncbi:hypothetical protein [Pseudoalteromonas sp. H105]|uniref:hypothetical protein n=1 Tax=Pseudoalteromonas sp. H105 TaxID=1348393 RepID=UPI0007323279|nr:hypothetical protein [Pseudoalteromonas sp. H105]KTF13709.1 hypothetical protein ATS75_14150 [Pseudoalteromonas sp. H105]
MEFIKPTTIDLQTTAILHWSEEMLEKADSLSALPILLKTQDEFIALLKVASKTPLSWASVLSESKALTPSIFLKHLMVLSDLGGEALNKLSPLSNAFPNNEITFLWNEEEFTYPFREIHNKRPLTNSALKVDAKSILHNTILTNRMNDTIMLLLFGSLDITNNLPKDAQDRCNIGLLMGNSEEIEKFVKENYIRVSKQLSGEKANSLGHASQKYVAKLLTSFLPQNWIIQEEGTLTGVNHADEGSPTKFDLTIRSPNAKEFGLEVSFQVTTNSTIERKARESQALHKKARKMGHRLCYIIDGAGNVNVRQKAIATIFQNSDYATSIAEGDINSLANYMIAVDDETLID